MENKLDQANKELGTNYSNWDDISKHQKLSEVFIKKYTNKINWNYSSAYQNQKGNSFAENLIIAAIALAVTLQKTCKKDGKSLA